MVANYRKTFRQAIRQQPVRGCQAAEARVHSPANPLHPIPLSALDQLRDRGTAEEVGRDRHAPAGLADAKTTGANSALLYDVLWFLAGLRQPFTALRIGRCIMGWIPPACALVRGAEAPAGYSTRAGASTLSHAIRQELVFTVGSISPYAVRQNFEV
jgi:hypothetical protein